MLNDDQLKDKSYLELHEQVKEMLTNNRENQEDLVKWFLTHQVTQSDVKELLIMSFLEDGLFTTNDLKKILTFKLKGGKND